MLKLKLLILFVIIISTSSCASKTSVNASVNPKPTASPTIPIDPSSNIGKVDENGITAAIDVPKNPVCSRKYVSVKLDTFETCLIDGLTYVQVANVLGYRGTLQAKSGNREIWQWNDGSGKYLTATFSGGKLISKSQIGLEVGT
jgi:hypothetical protein